MRKDKLILNHWSKVKSRREDKGSDQESAETEVDADDSRAKLFAKFNSKTDIIRYTPEEYERAGIPKLTSSSSWTKEETDCLMDLCERFDLRFNVITDRFVSELRERQDATMINRLDLDHLCKTAKDYWTNKYISENEKRRIKKRHLKTIEKYFFLNRINPVAFDRTVDEIKYRYYDVARAVLKYRGDSSQNMILYDSHSPLDPKLKYQLQKNFMFQVDLEYLFRSNAWDKVKSNLFSFNIEDEITRKNNWERVYSRLKEHVDKEKQHMTDFLNIESQIKAVENKDMQKLRLVGEMMGIKVPPPITSHEENGLKKLEYEEQQFMDISSENIFHKIGIPRATEALGEGESP